MTTANDADTRPRLLRHLVILALLAGLLLLAFLLSSGEDEQQALSLPPLPHADEGAQQEVGQQPLTLGRDLRLATRRPVLTEPGLHFVEHAPDTAPATTQGGQQKAEAGRTPARQQKETAREDTPPQPEAVEQPADVETAQADTREQSASVSDASLFAALPADAWLLQVAAAPNREAADRRCQSLSLACVSYAAERHGRQLWILVVGPFNSRASAEAAVAQLPEELQQQGPFPREVSAVRADAS